MRFVTGLFAMIAVALAGGLVGKATAEPAFPRLRQQETSTSIGCYTCPHQIYLAERTPIPRRIIQDVYAFRPDPTEDWPTWDQIERATCLHKSLRTMPERYVVMEERTTHSDVFGHVLRAAIITPRSVDYRIVLVLWTSDCEQFSFATSHWPTEARD